MNLFTHMIFPRRNTTVELRKVKNKLRITVEGSIGERVVIEVEHIGELKLQGLRAND